MFATNYIAKVLKLLGKSLYTYPGGTIAPLYHELINEEVELICSRAEQGAGYMAIADALITGTPSFVAVTSGPGATNIITCIADAYYDSIPLIVFTGQIGTVDLSRSNNLRQRGFQEVPIIEVVKSITKKEYQPQNVDELINALKDAYMVSQNGRSGPVLIDLPMNVQMTKVDQKMVREFDFNCFTSNKSGPGHDIPEEILRTVKADIEAAQKPLLLVGGGAKHSCQQIRTLAESSTIPVVASLRGIGVLPSNHPLFVGWIGHTGLPWANKALQAADLLLVLGSRLDVRQTGTELEIFNKKKIIHVDIDENELRHARITPSHSIHSDIGTFVRKLDSCLAHASNGFGNWLKEIQEMKETNSLGDHGEENGVCPDQLLRYINLATIEGKTAVVTGVGSHQQWASRYFSFDNPRKMLFTSAGHGTMGYALPVAIGIKRIDKDRLVICIDGDGSFQMNIQELACIREHDTDIKIVVMENNRLGIVSQFQNIAFGDDPLTGKFLNPDFSRLAEVYGIKAWSLNEIDEDIIDRWLNHNGPSLLHVKIQHDAPVSPMLLAGQALDNMWRRNN